MKKTLGIVWIVSVIMLLPGLMVWVVEESNVGMYGIAYFALFAGLLIVSCLVIAAQIADGQL